MLLFGEYNVASGRVSGSTNDQCRVWRSTDLGQTWSVLLEWNTNGSSSQVRHVHGIVQDPITGLIYVLIGDDPTSGIIRWNGSASAPPANTALTSYGNYTGWAALAVSGALTDYYRAGDLIFSGDFGAYLTDRSDSATFSKPTSISRAGPLTAQRGPAIDVSQRRDPLIGLSVPGGAGLWMSLWDTSLGGSRGFDVWYSTDCVAWARIGYLPDIGVSGTVGVLTNLAWTRDGKILVTVASGNAKLVNGSYGGSLVFNTDTLFSGTAGALA